MQYDHKRAIELLRIGSGKPDAQFRDGQEDAIRHIVEGGGKLLVVQRTGWGKSFVYFIATRLLREGGTGPALLISPLLSLMRNQIAAAERMGVRAETINSDNPGKWGEVEAKARNNQVDILLVSPERLANDRFREDFLPNMADRLAMLVIDEAHCISDWGHDFRPDYRRIETIIRNLPPNFRILGTTATANDRVVNDLVEVLGPNIETQRGDLGRPSLLLQTIRMPGLAERMAWLAERLKDIPGSGIIYTLTKRDAYQVTRWLKSQGLNVEAYTGDVENREGLEEALQKNQVKALVATVSLGMGYDKPDLAFVIHFQMPKSVTAYYQQVGRAGRAVDAAYGVLLSGEEDIDINNYFIDSAFPTPGEVEQVLSVLRGSPRGLSEFEILSLTNLKNGRLDRVTKILSMESPAPLVNQSRGYYPLWHITAARLSSEFWERIERITVVRRNEQKQMLEYIALKSGHMEFLIRALDGNPENVTAPNLKPLPAGKSQEMIRKATEFIRISLSIEPRKYKGNYPCSRGQSLCLWGDLEFGKLIQDGKYRYNRFSDKLVDASAQLIRQRNFRPSPAWITCVPSQRRPNLVPDFALRLAESLDLPFSAALRKVANRPEQKSMPNGVQQRKNVEASLEVVSANLMRGPVLLVDDMVDSCWTFTIAASLLRNSGSPVVFPFALANSRPGMSDMDE